MDTPSEVKTKTAHIGRTAFEIPAHMTISGMVEVWQHESEVFEALVKSIVENHPRLASDIAYAWAGKHDYYLISKADHHRELLRLQPEVVEQMKTLSPDYYKEIMAVAEADKASQ